MNEMDLALNWHKLEPSHAYPGMNVGQEVRMKSFLIIVLMILSMNSKGATHTLNFSEPVKLKKVLVKKSVQLNFVSLYRPITGEKLVSKN